MNTAYEEMVYGAAVAYGNADPDALAAMERAASYIFRTIENVTPEMDDAWHLPDWRIDETSVARAFRAMLSASPLAPPKAP